MSVGDNQGKAASYDSALIDFGDHAAQLFEAQQRLKALMDALPVGVNFSDDVTCQRIWANPASQAQFEVGPEGNVSASAQDARAPGRQAKFLREGHQVDVSELPIQRAVAENRIIPPTELEIELASGRRWFSEISAAPIHDRSGNVIGGVAVVVDITDRKRYAEQLLIQKVREKISGQLIEAQERERSRIARELHDDVCQRLAMLTLELEQATMSPEISTERLMEIRDRYGEITNDLQAISHELHSSKLEYLGIVPALRSFCHEFSEKRSVNIDFTHDNVPEELSGDIPLCLFRIAQEALHNALKHSGTRDFAVHLCGAEDHIELVVRDDGGGFDPKSSAAHQGLGLVSMRERVGLIGGTFSVESSPDSGTTVRVRISLENQKAAR